MNLSRGSERHEERTRRGEAEASRSFGFVLGLGPWQRITARRFGRQTVATGLLIVALSAGVIALTPSGTLGGQGGVAHTVASPDGRIEVSFFLVPGGGMSYSVRADGWLILQPSTMGLSFRDQPPLAENLLIESVGQSSLDETWRPVWGTASRIVNRHNEMTVRLREATGSERTIEIIFRAYDDGVAFRYVLPEQRNLGAFDIVSEETAFRFYGEGTAWWIPNDWDSYEHLYRETPLSEVTGANTPVTVHTHAGLYVSIHEANLTDYAGMTLVPEPEAPDANALKVELVPWPDGVTRVIGRTPFASPWRTIQIARRPGELLESNLILNLNEPCAIEDTSWITPMKYVGIWWGMHIDKYSWHEGPDHGATTENAMRHIDFAASHGIGGVLVEGWNTGWDRWGARGAFDYVTPYDDFDLEAVAAYARSKGVALIGHHETGGDAEDYESRVDDAFDLYGRLGVTAVKTGYAGGIYPRGQHHHGQWMVQHYRTIVKKAADHGIMLDVHEPIKDTGISRTYPNMMTREGVRGMEYNAWSDGNPPEHTTVLPFTRMLSGPLDYTPGIFDLTFDEHKPDNRVYSTRARQLALYVVLFSPLQMAADLPGNYEGDPAFEFIQRVPVTWDETRGLDARIGDYAVVARRSGEDWYLGAVTDERERVLQVALDFLEEGRRYHARVFRDAPAAHWMSNPLPVEIDTLTVRGDDELSLELAPGGGQAIWFRPTVRR
jgi:alpha-glucosidase